MHSNLILGFVALALLWVLVRRLWERSGGKDREAVNDAGEMLSRELDARREAERLRRDFPERLERIGRRKLETVADALARMREAMPEGEGARLAWELKGKTLRVSILPVFPGADTEQATGMPNPPALLRELPPVLIIRWDIPDLNLDACTASEKTLESMGVYGVRVMERREEYFSSLAGLISHLARFLANALA